jgi:hypothetical protein
MATSTHVSQEENLDIETILSDMVVMLFVHHIRNDYTR